MLIGIGVDVLKISRLAPIADNPSDPFFLKAFTKQERDQATSRQTPLRYYAARFAGKEAVYKAISVCKCDFVPSDIEILDMVDGRPTATISGSTADMLRSYAGAEVVVHLSLSYEEDSVVAFALVLQRA